MRKSTKSRNNENKATKYFKIYWKAILEIKFKLDQR